MEPDIQPLPKEGSNTWPQGLCSLQRCMGNSFLLSLLPIPVPFASLLCPRAVMASSPSVLVAVGKRAGIVSPDDPA